MAGYRSDFSLLIMAAASAIVFFSHIHVQVVAPKLREGGLRHNRHPFYSPIAIHHSWSCDRFPGTLASRCTTYTPVTVLPSRIVFSDARGGVADVLDRCPCDSWKESLAPSWEAPFTGRSPAALQQFWP